MDKLLEFYLNASMVSCQFKNISRLITQQLKTLVSFFFSIPMR